MCFSFAKHWVFKTSNHVTSLYSEGKIKLICLRPNECGIHLSNQLMNSNLLYSLLKGKKKKKNRLKNKRGKKNIYYRGPNTEKYISEQQNNCK